MKTTHWFKTKTEAKAFYEGAKLTEEFLAPPIEVNVYPPQHTNQSSKYQVARRRTTAGSTVVRRWSVDVEILEIVP